MSGLCSTLQSLNTNLLSESESELDDVINTKRSLLFDSDFRRRLESTSSDGTDRMFVPRSHDRTRSSSCDGRRLPERPNYFHCRCCGKWKPSEIPNCDDVSEWNHHQHQQHQQHQLIRDQTDTRKPGLNRSRDIQTETDASFRQTDRERGKPPPYKLPISSPSSLRPCHPTPISSPSLSRSSSRCMSSPSSSPSPARYDPFSAQTHNPAHRLGRSGSLERPEVRESDGDDDWWASPREPDVDSRTSESLHSFDSDSPDRTYVPIELVPSFIPETFPRRRQCQSLDRVPRSRTEAWSVEKENHKQNANQRIIITQEHFSLYQTDRSGLQVRDTIRSVSDYERSDNDSPVHHGPPVTSSSDHHGPPATPSSVHHGPPATSSSVNHGPPATTSSVHHGPTATSSSVHAPSSQTTPESLRTRGKPPIPPFSAETVSQKPDQVRTYQCLEGSQQTSHSHKNSRLSERQSKPADLHTNFSRTGSVRQGQPSRPVTHRPPRAPARMLLVNKFPPSATFPPAVRPRDSEGNTPSRPPKPSAPPPTENPPPLPPRGRPPLHPERAGARLSRQDTKSRPQVKTSAAQMPVGKSLKNPDNKYCKSGESLSDQKQHLAEAADPKSPPKRPPKSWTPGSGSRKPGSCNADMPPPLPPRARRSQSVDSVFSVRGARDQHAGWGAGGSDQRRTASEGDNQKLILEILV